MNHRGESPIRILLIEDAEADYLRTRSVLRQSGVEHTLDWASSYEDGLEAVRARTHDVYLVDHKLGLEEGVELVRLAREEGHGGAMILLTGMDLRIVAADAVAAGVSGFLTKQDLTPDNLIRSIRHTLGQAQEAAALEARARQSSALTQVARAALGGAAWTEVLGQAARAAADVLELTHASVVEYQPGEEQLIVRGTVGWDPAVVGISLAPGTGSQAGYTVQTGDIVVVEDYSREARFDVTGFPEEDLTSGVSVVIQGTEQSYGVLSVESRASREFHEEEREFLRSMAGVLAIAAEERQAREAQERLTEILEGTPDLVGMADAEGRTLFLNPAGRELLGYGAEEDLTGIPIWRYHPEWAREILEQDAIPGVLERGVWRGETALESKKGEEIPVSQVLMAHRGPDGELEFLSTVVRDLSADRKAQARIRFQARLLEAVGEAVIATDLEGRIRFWNRAAEDLYGWKASEVIGLSVNEVTVPPSERDTAAGILRGVRQGETWSGEFLARHKGDRFFPIQVSLAPILDEGGEVTGFVGVSEDISDRKAAEEDLKRREERFRSLIENASDTIKVLDQELRLRYASGAGQMLLGRSVREAIGKEFLELNEVHPDDEAELERTVREVRTNPGKTFTVVVRLKHSDGTWRVVETRMRNLLHKPAVQGIVVNSRDITERVELEQQLLQAQKMEAIGRLAGGVAHDFNNILTGILGLTRLVLDEMPEDDPRAEDLEEVCRAANRAVDLTSQLLAFGRRQVVEPRILDLSSVLEGMRSMLGRLIGEDVELVIACDASRPTVRLDPGQVEQVVLNMVVNARDAMPTGGSLTMRVEEMLLNAPLETATGSVEEGRYVVLDVEDDGDGIPGPVREHLFEPFFTTKEMGKGTGLGLSTVYGIVRQAGGHIDVESREGEGTLFRLILPWVDGMPGPEVEPRERSTPRGGKVILVAEDDEAVRRVTARTLASHGFEVFQACDGADALDLVQGQGVRPDLVITDAVMPGMRWDELVSELRVSLPATPVLLVSGYAEEDLKGEADAGRVDRFLEKPFAPDQLLQQVQEILGELS